MMVYRGRPETWDPPAGGSGVAVGVFDGVHRGHLRVVAALDAANTKVVLTFGTHPAAALSPQGEPPKLTTLKGRLALFAASGIDRTAILDFDDEMISMAAEAFVERVLVNEETSEIEALVIKRGVVFHRESVLPVRYVREICDGVVRVQISSADLKALETFE